jgi:hypothetical protein
MRQAPITSLALDGVITDMVQNVKIVQPFLRHPDEGQDPERLARRVRLWIPDQVRDDEK